MEEPALWKSCLRSPKMLPFVKVVKTKALQMTMIPLQMLSPFDIYTNIFILSYMNVALQQGQDYAN